MADRFEAHRGHLRAVAYRVPGSLPEADDAVQEAWLRLHRVVAYEVTAAPTRPRRLPIAAPDFHRDLNQVR